MSSGVAVGVSISVVWVDVSINALIGARQRPNRMPASMALASAEGIAATARPNVLINPAATINRPATRNAPVAAANPPAGAPVAASSAAPGRDHAPEISIRNHKLDTMPASPIAIESIIKPDAACASLAPTAVKPLSTTAKELAKPTKAVTTPAPMGTASDDLDMQRPGSGERESVGASLARPRRRGETDLASSKGFPCISAESRPDAHATSRVDSA